MTSLKKQWFHQWNAEGKGRWDEFIRSSVRFFSLIVIYFLLKTLFFRLATLSFEAYEEPSIYTGILYKIWSNYILLGAVLLILVVLNRHLLLKWEDLDKGSLLRKFLLFIAAILTWRYAFYDYNYFFDQSHLTDRLLLLVFFGLVYWRPVFLIPFVIAVLAMIGQFEVLMGFSLADPLFLLQLLLLFLAFFFFRMLTGYFSFTAFLYLAVCILASNYFFSGLGKLNTEWILNDQIKYLLPATYSNGWLAGLNRDTINNLAESLGWFNLPLKIFTLIVECGLILFFFRLKFSRYLLMGVIMLHIGIFVFTGILFWKWMLIHLFFLLFLLKKEIFEGSPYFKPLYFILSVFLILTAYVWNRPVRLVWHDVPMSYTHRFEAETESGKVYELGPDFFSPYDYQFTLSNFNYLNRSPRLGIVWGATGDPEVSSFFNTPRSVEEILEFEKEHGYSIYNEKQKEAFVNFVRDFTSHRNQKNTNTSYLSFLKAPDLLWTFSGDTSSQPEDKISFIRVIQVTTYYSEEKGYQEIRKELVLEITIS